METAIKYLINNLFIVNANIFYSTSEGIISPVSVPASPKYQLAGFEVLNPQIYDNLGKQISYGFNLGLDYQKIISKQASISIYGNYGFIDGSLDHDEDGLQIRNLPGISKHTIKAGGSLKVNKLTASLRFIGMDKQRVINIGATQLADGQRYQELDGYIISNLYLNYQVKTFNFYLKAHNLFNSRYRNVNIGAAPEGNALGSGSAEFQNGAPQNPIRIMGGIKLKIN
jgi:hypothetical protein